MLNHEGIQNYSNKTNMMFKKKTKKTIDSEHFHLFRHSVRCCEKLPAGLSGDVRLTEISYVHSSDCCPNQSLKGATCSGF